MRNRAGSFVAATLYVVALSQCSSSQTPAGVEMPEVVVTQARSQLESFNMRGRISVPYVIEISNPNSFPIELDRIRLRTIGAGAYEIGDTVEEVSFSIGPGETKVYPFSIPAFAVGGETAVNLPTNIRVTAYFDSPEGSFRRIISATVGGFAGSV